MICFFLQISLLSSIVLRHAWCSLTAVCCLARLEAAWQFQGYLTEIGQAVHQCATSNLSSLRRLKWPQAFSSCFKRFKTLSTKKWVFLMNTVSFLPAVQIFWAKTGPRNGFSRSKYVQNCLEKKIIPFLWVRPNSRAQIRLYRVHTPLLSSPVYSM